MAEAISQSRGRMQFLLLATLFCAPLIAAYTLYFGFPESRPRGTTNYGELVSPARPLPALPLVGADGAPRDESALKSRWTLIQFADGGCGQDCLARLVLSRQTRTALHEKRDRVLRVLIVENRAQAALIGERVAAEQPDLLVLAEAAGSGTLARFFDGASSGTLYLIDPLGNWLMSYPSGAPIEEDFKGLEKDLNKLLRLSKIG